MANTVPLLQVQKIGAQEVLVTNSAFWSQVNELSAHHALKEIEKILREKKPKLFKE